MICEGAINTSLKRSKNLNKNAKMVDFQAIFVQIYQIESSADVASGTNAV